MLIQKRSKIFIVNFYTTRIILVISEWSAEINKNEVSLCTQQDQNQEKASTIV